MAPQSERQIHHEVSFDEAREVSQFITRVWEHPLVDDRLITFRQDALTLISENMKRHGIEDTEYIGIPVGSFLWAVNDESDIDVHIIQVLDEDTQTSDSRFDNSEVAPIDDIHFVSLEDDHVSTYPPTSHLALLLTPDDYLLGNTERAGSLRLELLNMVEKESSQYRFWDSPDSVLKSRQFDRYFRSWGMKEEKRIKRFEEKVTLRSSQTYNDDAWRKGFYRALTNIQVPVFDIYKSALLQTGGKLSLDSQFSSRGIKTE